MVVMIEMNTDQIYKLAQLVGIKLDDQRAEAILSKLKTVLDELNLIPDDVLNGVEPDSTFTYQGEEVDG